MSAVCPGKGADVLLAPSAFMPTTGAAHWEVLLRARAIETQCYVAAAAQWGTHNDKRASYGHALLVDPWGAVLADLGAEGNGVAVAEGQTPPPPPPLFVPPTHPISYQREDTNERPQRCGRGQSAPVQRVPPAVGGSVHAQRCPCGGGSRARLGRLTVRSLSQCAHACRSCSTAGQMSLLCRFSRASFGACTLHCRAMGARHLACICLSTQHWSIWPDSRVPSIPSRPSSHSYSGGGSSDASRSGGGGVLGGGGIPGGGGGAPPLRGSAL